MQTTFSTKTFPNGKFEGASLSDSPDEALHAWLRSNPATEPLARTIRDELTRRRFHAMPERKKSTQSGRAFRDLS